MTSLVFGIACIYIAFLILRLPDERFRQELDQISGRPHGLPYYRFIRRLVWAVGFLGGAIILLRFF